MLTNAPERGFIPRSEKSLMPDTTSGTMNVTLTMS